MNLWRARGGGSPYKKKLKGAFFLHRFNSYSEKIPVVRKKVSTSSENDDLHWQFKTDFRMNCFKNNPPNSEHSRPRKDFVHYIDIWKGKNIDL